MKKIVVAAVAVALVASAFGSAAAAPRVAKFRRASSRSDQKVLNVHHEARDALYRAYKGGELSAAGYALQRALSLYRHGRVAARYGYVARPKGRDATMILRDLVARRDELSGADRALAGRVLARPTDGRALPGRSLRADVSPLCSPHFCVHYASSGVDAPDPTDLDANGEPDYIDAVVATFEEVYTKQVIQDGYRAPLPDFPGPGGRSNPDARLDVYVSDLGGSGLYGFCQPEPDPANTFFDAPGFCGVDNDFDVAQFPSGASGIAALQVTAAHEFFHAVQFSYDYFEDRWFSEGTAAWMEDEVYDDINDNYQYLTTSAISFPEVPVDYGDEGFQYGAFLYWRYLSELLGAPTIKEVWERADGSAVGQDDYSTLAVENVLAMHGASFGPVFADFAAANYIANEVYEEGDGYVATAGFPPEARAKATKRVPLVVGSFPIDHMSTTYAAVKPGKGIRNNARLRVKVDMPSASTGSWATAIVLMKNGPSQVVPINTNSSGNGKVKVTFSKSRVLQVGVALTNASTAFTDCYAGSPFSCMGVPLDDGLDYRITARAIN